MLNSFYKNVQVIDFKKNLKEKLYINFESWLDLVHDDFSLTFLCVIVRENGSYGVL